MKPWIQSVLGRRAAVALLAGTYVMIGAAFTWVVIKWTTHTPEIETLSNEKVGPSSMHWESAEYLPLFVSEDWRRARAGILQFEVVRLGDAENATIRSREISIRNISRRPVWFHEFNKRLICHVFVKEVSGDLSAFADVAVIEDGSCGMGSHGDAWKCIGVDSEIHETVSWESDRSSCLAFFVVNVWADDTDCPGERTHVIACSELFQLDS